MSEEKSLKAQNIVPLAAIYTGTVFLLSIVHFGVEEVSTYIQLAKQVGTIATIGSLGGVLSNFLPNSAKHILVFLRFHNVLPGHRCKRVCEKDSRLSVEHLEKKWPELFVEDMDESVQNSYWYSKIYSPARNAPEVLQAHRSFLLYRDAASGLFILIIGLLVWRVLSNHFLLPSLGAWPLLLLFVIFLLIAQAARQSGNRIVVNAVAVSLRSND